ncbi:unnamed protein product [Clonostachys chloroleuca]|uniref:Uncharacterized protein n=1 Tax=Clonostachys chloroleuca TaxID=1926264 RepID=A0AA35PY82_9HYPO|nr:unnamed protein product [Clonostachys chloroleuca]
MKFSRVLFFTSLALSVPTALVEKDEPALLLDERQNDPVSAVITALNSVTNTINTSGGAIQSAINGITGNVDAQVQVLIRANLDAILNALQNSIATILASTLDSTGNITAAASGLTQAQINNLAAAIQGAVAAVNKLRIIVTLTATDLTPAVFDLVQGQITAIQNTIQPFIAPVAAFANAVSRLNVRLGIYVLGLSNATATLVNTIQNLLAGLGLGGLGNLLG